MSILARLTLALFVLFAFSSDPIVIAEETGKYGQWQTTDDRLDKMIKDLEQIIEEGSNSRAAHPEFLKDLQRTIDQYRTPRKIVFFSDDFADYDFTNNPSWSVSSGEYIVDRYGSLYSSIAIRRPALQEETASNSDDDKGMRILFGVLNELAKGGQGQETGGDEVPEQAVIYSNAAIPNNFTMQFSFRSAANWGSTSIGLFQGDDPKSGYHLVYQASPADNRPMQLVKYRYGKPYVIEEVIQDSPNLDDGIDHSLLFNRSQNGDMVVMVDGKEILRTSDLTYKDDFNGIVIMNNGGSYSYDNIELFIEQ